MPKPHTDQEKQELLRKNLEEYAQAKLPCDIVLKGGAASGFVYAGVATRLAKRFRLQSIGGTSAGAGAAGVFAAAEYGRRSLPEDEGPRSVREKKNPDPWAFAGIEHIRDWAGERTPDGGTRLRHLFAPDPENARLFQIVAAVFPLREGGWRKALVVAAGAYLARTLYGLLAAAALVGFALLNLGTPAGAVTLVLVALLGIAAAMLFGGVLVALGIWADVKRLPENGFAFCSANSRPVNGAQEAEAGAPPERMTGWLYGLYQQLAGKPLGEPLTFGDLWSKKDPGTKEGIRLSLMTVNLSLGRPVQVTCDDTHETLERGEAYYFDPEEFGRLFPPEVVTALERASQGREVLYDSRRLLPLPPTAELPIIVGVRMSFALPILFRAVPLYKRDRTRLPLKPRGVRTAEDEPIEKCWFVDGGVCSNLPIHFFDKPLPRWPTFAVNLRDRHPDHDHQSGTEAAREKIGPLDVWIDNDFAGDKSPQVPLREWWRWIDRVPKPHSLGEYKDEKSRGLNQMKRFLMATLETLVNWTDQEQLRLAGSRDRVVQVCLGENEGSFNFAMKPEEIEWLVDLGAAAGTKLVERFADDSKGWPQHRGVRYVTAVQAAARYVDDFEAGYRYAKQSDAFGRVAVEEELRLAGLLGSGNGDDLKTAQVDAIAQLTWAMLMEERRVPEPHDEDWPDHVKLKPDFTIRLTPAP